MWVCIRSGLPLMVFDCLHRPLVVSAGLSRSLVVSVRLWLYVGLCRSCVLPVTRCWRPGPVASFASGRTWAGSAPPQADLGVTRLTSGSRGASHLARRRGPLPPSGDAWFRVTPSVATTRRARRLTPILTRADGPRWDWECCSLSVRSAAPRRELDPLLATEDGLLGRP